MQAAGVDLRLRILGETLLEEAIWGVVILGHVILAVIFGEVILEDGGFRGGVSQKTAPAPDRPPLYRRPWASPLPRLSPQRGSLHLPGFSSGNSMKILENLIERLWI